jgi:hypothetical protein
LLASLPTDVCGVLMDLLCEERSARLRQILRQLLEPHVLGHQAVVMRRIREGPGRGGADLLRALSAQAPEAARRLVMELVVDGPPEIRLECIHIIGRNAQGGTARRLLIPLLNDPSTAARETAGQMLRKFRDDLTFRAVQTAAERQSTSPLGPGTAKVLGETLAAIDPDQAYRLFGQWTQTRSRLRASRIAHQQLTKIAICGLAALDDPRVDGELKALAERNRGELAAEATRARVERARRLKAPPAP